jgi:protein SCO1/2
MKPVTGSAIPAKLRFAPLALAVAGLLALTACSGSPAAQVAKTTGGMTAGQAQAAAANPSIDQGTSLHGLAAPDLHLVNQFGQRVSLSRFRGKVIILAFTDSECTTICPLTTVSMVEAKDLLGAAGQQVQLLGVDANPDATKVANVKAYSAAHSMTNAWDFLTGSLPQLRASWKAYHIAVQIENGDIDHTPALYVIDARGREQKLYLTTMAYTSVSQSAEILAQEVSSLLPSHPKLKSQQSLAQIKGLGPASAAVLPSVGSGQVTIGPGHAHLLVFFTTWLTETSDLRGHLLALNQYVAAARRSGLPALTAVDEASTEPSLGSAAAYLHGLKQRPDYPVALDTTGRLADGYAVQDQPWLVLTSAAGKIVWKHDGWVPVKTLLAAARRA